MNSAHIRCVWLTLLVAFLFCKSHCFAAESKSTSPPATNGAPAKLDKEAESRLKWNLDTLVGDYNRHGKRNPKWDEAARAGLTGFAEARIPTTRDWQSLAARIADATRKAVTNGCDDPLILYLYARYVTSTERHTPKEYADAFRRSAEGLSKSEYSPIRKFYAALRTAETLKPGTNTPPEVHEWRIRANEYLNEALRDKSMPVREAYDACEQLLTVVKQNPAQYERFYRSFETNLFNNWPSDESIYLLKGIFYLKYAWNGRGGEYAPKVTDKGWELFATRLAEAEKALNKAWELDPHDARIAREMITLELGQGKGRPRMELWFKRATDLDPNYYDAFEAKRYYLEPKWYGSPEDMLEFGRECVNSKKWGGHTALILRDAHESLARYLDEADRPAYWKQPSVWKDIHAAFEKFFELNPDEIGWHHNYALYAYRAEQWDELNRQLPLLGEVNYEFFGGRQKYDKMVQEAKAHQKKAGN